MILIKLVLWGIIIEAYLVVNEKEGVHMKYSCSDLWKLLIDKRITTTELRLQTCISTNMLAKMGKEEPVSMEILAKNNIPWCGIDDIVEFRSEEKE